MTFIASPPANSRRSAAQLLFDHSPASTALLETPASSNTSKALPGIRSADRRRQLSRIHNHQRPNPKARRPSHYFPRLAACRMVCRTNFQSRERNCRPTSFCNSRGDTDKAAETTTTNFAALVADQSCRDGDRYRAIPNRFHAAGSRATARCVGRRAARCRCLSRDHRPAQSLPRKSSRQRPTNTRASSEAMRGTRHYLPVFGQITAQLSC